MDSIILARPQLMSKYERRFAAKHFRIEESRVLCKDSLVIGRYSVLPYYEELDRDLRLLGSRLINSVEAHEWICNFAYYNDVKEFTPESWDESTIHQCQHKGPFVVKGKRSSRKWQWKSQMFAETKTDALALGERLKDDPEIKEQGIVYRRYVPLKTFEIGHNDLPYTNEWRLFYLKDTLLNAGYYWSVGDCYRQASMAPECNSLAEQIAQVASQSATFYTLDLAETADGGWILIEINDGQMAVPSEHDLDALYGNLRAAATR